MNLNTFETSDPAQLARMCPPASGALKIRYKVTPTDFIVEEIPLYEPSGRGTHAWFWIEKRDMTTHAVARALAQKLHKNPADAGIAGLKDAHAVARQWITFENVSASAEEIASLSGEQFKILAVSRHANKLRMGHLRGNRFAIRIKIDASGHDSSAMTTLLDRTNDVLGILTHHGIPNYFGEQRFGNAGNNAAMGKLLVLGDTAGFHSAMAAAGQGHSARDRKMRNLLVNAFQSELFNGVLGARMPDMGKILTGDLACLHRNGAVFKIATDDDARKEQPRADAHEISPSGPIFGPKMPRPDGLPGSLEARILQEACVACADFGRKEAEHQPGARRPLRVFFLEDPEARADGDAVLLRFALPSGSYATVVLNEI